MRLERVKHRARIGRLRDVLHHKHPDVPGLGARVGGEPGLRQRRVQPEWQRQFVGQRPNRLT